MFLHVGGQVGFAFSIAFPPERVCCTVKTDKDKRFHLWADKPFWKISSSSPPCIKNAVSLSEMQWVSLIRSLKLNFNGPRHRSGPLPDSVKRFSVSLTFECTCGLLGVGEKAHLKITMDQKKKKQTTITCNELQSANSEDCKQMDTCVNWVSVRKWSGVNSLFLGTRR